MQDGPAPPRRPRFPAHVHDVGREPDPRFTLANERTFLSGIRTSLALLAAGVALEALSLPLQPGLRLAASLLLVVLGLATPLAAWHGWARDEKAMRRGEPLAAPAAVVPLAVGTTTAGVLVLLALLLR